MEEMSLPFIDSVLVHLYIEVPFKAGLTVCCAYCPYKLYALYPQGPVKMYGTGYKTTQIL
jgi:hypothetical protein